MCNQEEKRVCNVGKTSHYITVQFALFTMINLNRKEFSTVISAVFVDLEAEKIFSIVTHVDVVFRSKWKEVINVWPLAWSKIVLSAWQISIQDDQVYISLNVGMQCIQIVSLIMLKLITFAHYARSLYGINRYRGKCLKKLNKKSHRHPCLKNTEIRLWPYNAMTASSGLKYRSIFSVENAQHAATTTQRNWKSH